ncbi:hypothetical protein THRCLA_20391 [Thraustotheca clavata]|uniref:Uncharacterized protein n=1 Tax=Thraustotheca clavata TaxID=74557 RepID=A0A1W0A8N3_9STRA|nr:hypothetical protein THRCLA_20391 [Thraustotheca clavata]
MVEQQNKVNRRVCFTTATEYSFHVGYNGSTVPHDVVPGIGLSGQHISVRQSNLSIMSEERHCIMRYTPKDRLYFLKRAGMSKQNVIDLSLHQRQLHLELTASIAEVQTLKNQEKIIKRKCQGEVDYTKTIKCQRIVC